MTNDIYIIYHDVVDDEYDLINDIDDEYHY